MRVRPFLLLGEAQSRMRVLLREGIMAPLAWFAPGVGGVRGGVPQAGLVSVSSEVECPPSPGGVVLPACSHVCTGCPPSPWMKTIL